MEQPSLIIPKSEKSSIIEGQDSRQSEVYES